MADNLFVYRAGCLDGVAGSWITRQALGENLSVVSLFPGRELIHRKTWHKNIFVAGVSLGRDVVKNLLAQNNRIFVFSMPSSGIEELNGFSDGEISKSCVVAAWDHFFDKKAIPRQLLYVRDRHLWENQYEETNDWCAGAHYFGIGYKAFAETMEKPVNEIVAYGKVVNHERNKQIDRLSRNAELVNFQEHLVVFVNAPNWLCSDLGNKLSQDHPFAVCYYDTETERVYELRSSKNNPNAVDVGRIATQLGGGGSFHTAGFSRKKNINHILLDI